MKKFIYIDSSFKESASLEYTDAFKEVLKKYTEINISQFQEYYPVVRGRYICLLQDESDQAFKVIFNSKAKKNTTVISTKESICKSLREKVESEYLIAPKFLGFVWLWMNRVFEYDNVVKLRALGYEPIKMDKFSFTNRIGYTSVEEEVGDCFRLSLEVLNKNLTFKQTKKFIKEQIKRAKAIGSSIRNTEKNRIKLNTKVEKFTERHGESLFAVAKKYKIIDFKLNKVEKVEFQSMSLQEQLNFIKSKSNVSEEQIINLINMYKGVKLVNKEELELYTFKSQNLPVTYRERGALELYKNSDSEGKAMYVLLDYRDVELSKDITLNVPIAGILYTIPEYLSGLKYESARAV